MQDGKTAPFNFRGFVSLLVTFSGLAMVVSGVVIYVMPEGRIAYWTAWHLFALDKEQWGTMHTCLSLIFFVGSCFHLYFNWRALLSYLKDRLKRSFSLRKEFIAALVLSLICLHGSIVGYVPFGSVMDLGKTLKGSWYDGQDVHPPFPHAELMPLKQLAKRIDFSLKGAIDHLRDKGYVIESGDVTLKELTENGDHSPAEVFETMMMDDRLYQ
ncbi:MAG: glycoside hydrolase family 18 [Desulfuromonas sp.]|nr:MAG: glycoside hydrolase family 18 [Desulfuromonas sp.]